MQGLCGGGDRRRNTPTGGLQAELIAMPTTIPSGRA